MKEFISTVAILGFSTVVAPTAFAQGGLVVFDPPSVEISGGIKALSQYVLRDAFAATPEPVVQGYLSASYDTRLYGEFSVNAWGSKGIATEVGDELDLGGTWKKNLGGDTSVKLVYNRYFLNGAPDMDEYTVVYANGDFDTSYTYYTWHDGMEDGQRINGGYNYAIDEKLGGRFDLTAETGLGLSDAIIIGVDLNFAFTDNFSVSGTLLIPFTEEDDGRDIEFVVGTGLSF